MPRGQCRQPETLSRMLGSEAVPGPRRSWAIPGGDETRAAIRKDVTAFAQAWFMGDAAAMLRCLHPDFVSRLMGVGNGTEARDGLLDEVDPETMVRSVVGLQGQFGAKIPDARRRLEVRVLEVGSRSASAVADLGGFMLHVHLVRAGGRWSIVNAMWELTP